MQNNGSKQAQQFIKKYKEERYVVDFYSDEYIAKITEKRIPQYLRVEEVTRST